MKKFNIVLHETTIINFPFFWKLMNRYRFATLVAPLLVFCYAFYYYSAQNTIFVRTINFKNIVSEQEGASSAIASVLGEKSSSLNESEVSGIIKSLDFQQDFSESLFQNPEFSKLDLSSAKDKKPFDMDEFLASCAGKKECIYKKVRGSVFGMISISGDRTITNSYILKVLSKDKFTTTLILNEARKAVVRTRVESIQRKLSQQIKLSEELVKTKRAELNDVDLTSLVERKKSLENGVESMDHKVRNYSKFLQSLKIKLALMETKVKETKRVANRKDLNPVNKVLTLQARKRLEEKIRKLESDIGAIKVVANEISNQDESILGQLEAELKRAQEKLSKQGKAGRSIASEMNFYNRKEGESNFTEFDYKVAKEQFAKTKADYDTVIVEKERLLKELADLDMKLEVIKPNLEYTQLLEGKIIQLKLLNSTVVSDLIFERELGAVMAFKQFSKSKMILFSAVASSVLLILITLCVYFFDDRIYDQFELAKSFEDLTIIGNTPDFD
jgi:hypothetical protein